MAELEAVARRIGHQAAHRQQLRHVAAGLGRQLQVPEIGRQPSALVALDGALDRQLAAVVGGDRQQPVAVEFIVQRLQVIERRARGLDRVAPAVVPPVLLEAEAAAGVGDELPQPRGARARVGIGLERALDDRQQRELARHIALLELADDVVQPQLGASEGALEEVRVVGKPVELGIDRGLIDVLELEAGAQALEQVGWLGGDEAVGGRPWQRVWVRARTVPGRDPPCRCRPSATIAASAGDGVGQRSPADAGLSEAHRRTRARHRRYARLATLVGLARGLVRAAADQQKQQQQGQNAAIAGSASRGSTSASRNGS